MHTLCVPVGFDRVCVWHGVGQISLCTGSGGMVGAGCPPSASSSARCKWCGQGTGMFTHRWNQVQVRRKRWPPLTPAMLWEPMLTASVSVLESDAGDF